MGNIANISLDVLLLLLRVAVVLLLYFFLWQVLRAVIRDLGSAQVQGSGGAQPSAFGSLIVLRSGKSGLAVGKVFPLGPSTLIGRSLEQCEIALNDSFLSQQHARIERRGDGWVLQDLQSTNGTFVNDVEVRKETVIEEGDVIRFGRVELRLTR